MFLVNNTLERAKETTKVLDFDLHGLSRDLWGVNDVKEFVHN